MVCMQPTQCSVLSFTSKTPVFNEHVRVTCDMRVSQRKPFQVPSAHLVS